MPRHALHPPGPMCYPVRWPLCVVPHATGCAPCMVRRRQSPPRLTPASPREFWAGAYRRSKWYFIALHCLGAIWRKGVSFVAHQQSEGYYQALVRLPAHLLQGKELHNASHADNQRLIKEHADVLEDVEGAHPEDDRDAVAEVDDGVLRLALEAPDALDKEAGFLALMQKHATGAPALASNKSTREYVGRDMKIYYDHFSHSSRRQRTWAVCPAGHPRCYRYRFTDTFASEKHCEAFLWAWASFALANEVSREEHQKYVPNEGEWEPFL